MQICVRFIFIPLWYYVFPKVVMMTSLYYKVVYIFQYLLFITIKSAQSGFIMSTRNLRKEKERMVLSQVGEN